MTPVEEPADPRHIRPHRVAARPAAIKIQRELGDLIDGIQIVVENQPRHPAVGRPDRLLDDERPAHTVKLTHVTHTIRDIREAPQQACRNPTSLTAESCV